MRGNAGMITSRRPEADFLPPELDGVEWTISICTTIKMSLHCRLNRQLLFSWSLPVPVCNALLFLRPIVIEFLSHVHTCGGFSLVAAWDESHQRLTDVCLSKCRLELEPDFVIVVCVFVLDCWIVVNTTWACAWGGFVLFQDLGYCPIVHLSVLCPPFSIKLLLKHKC